MNEERRKRWSGWYWWPFLLPLMYALSVGPVVKIYVELDTAGYDIAWTVPYLEDIYFPSNWACEKSESVSGFFYWYMEQVWRIV